MGGFEELVGFSISVLKQDRLSGIRLTHYCQPFQGQCREEKACFDSDEISGC